jgi:hypothetical protein
MELVCDNSELNGIWGAEAPDAGANVCIKHYSFKE